MGWGGEEGDWEVLKDLDFGEERAAMSTALFILICPFSPEGRVTVESRFQSGLGHAGVDWLEPLALLPPTLPPCVWSVWRRPPSLSWVPVGQ